MADAVVSSVVGRLGQLLIQQVVFLQGVKDEVEWLRNKLEWMLCFLRDAKEKQHADNRICKWVSDIRDVSYEAKDIVDIFILVEEHSRVIGFKASIRQIFLHLQQRSFPLQTGKSLQHRHGNHHFEE